MKTASPSECEGWLASIYMHLAAWPHHPSERYLARAAKARVSPIALARFFAEGRDWESSCIAVKNLLRRFSREEMERILELSLQEKEKLKAVIRSVEPNAEPARNRTPRDWIIKAKSLEEMWQHQKSP